MAIPVFPSRAFRHNGIYVNSQAGIDRPEDLHGKSVGIPEYQVTAAVWIRGILAELHGLPPEAVRYRTGGLHSPGRSEKIESLPPGIDIQPIGEGPDTRGYARPWTDRRSVYAADAAPLRRER